MPRAWWTALFQAAFGICCTCAGGVSTEAEVLTPPTWFLEGSRSAVLADIAVAPVGQEGVNWALPGSTTAPPVPIDDIMGLYTTADGDDFNHTAYQMDLEDDVTRPMETSLQVIHREVKKFEILEYWVEDGCRSSATVPLAGRFAKTNDAAAMVQCCTTDVAPQCNRLFNGRCPNATSLLNYQDALEFCQSSGMRLCTREELRTSDALGCCGKGCGLDDGLVWTGTVSRRTLRRLNRKLRQEVKKLNDELSSTLAEQKDLEERLQKLKSQWNSSMTLTTTPDTRGLTNDDIRAIASENRELKSQFDELAHQRRALVHALKNAAQKLVSVGGAMPAMPKWLTRPEPTGHTEAERGK